MMQDNKVLRLLFEFQTEYLGEPSYITGNAFRHCISNQINVSFGMFTDEKSLKSPKTYNEFFYIRTKKCPIFRHVHKWYSKIEKKAKTREFFTVPGITFDIINPPNDFLKFVRERDIVQVGGGRNNGYGLMRLVDYIEISISDLELPDIASHVTLISPMLEIPNYLEPYKCRWDTLKIWNHGKSNLMKIVPPRQFFRIKKEQNVERIALKGILRAGALSQFGLNEFKVHDWTNGGN